MKYARIEIGFGEPKEDSPTELLVIYKVGNILRNRLRKCSVSF
jgi:hypothetical protein